MSKKGCDGLLYDYTTTEGCIGNLHRISAITITPNSKLLEPVFRGSWVSELVKAPGAPGRSSSGEREDPTRLGYPQEKERLG